MSIFCSNFYVIDDDEVVCCLLGLLLLLCGYVVQVFVFGEDFLNGVVFDQFGVVVFDLWLNGMSGLQVFDVLCVCMSLLVVLFLLGYGDILMVVEVVQYGVFGWLEKFCVDVWLLEVIEKVFVCVVDVGMWLQVCNVVLVLWIWLMLCEIQVVCLVVEGLANKCIVQVLVFIELCMVEMYCVYVFVKLGLVNSYELDCFICEYDLQVCCVCVDLCSFFGVSYGRWYGFCWLYWCERR